MWPAFLSSKGVGVHEWCAVATTSTSCWYRVHSIEERMFFCSNIVITHGEKAHTHTHTHTRTHTHTHTLYLLRRRGVHWNLSYVSYTVGFCVTYKTEFWHRDFRYDYEDYYDWDSELFEYKSKCSVLSYILTSLANKISPFSHSFTNYHPFWNPTFHSVEKCSSNYRCFKSLKS